MDDYCRSFWRPAESFSWVLNIRMSLFWCWFSHWSITCTLCSSLSTSRFQRCVCWPTFLLFACDPGDQTGECRAHGNLGSAFFSKGNYREALTNHRHQLVLAMKLKDREVRSLLNRPNWESALRGVLERWKCAKKPCLPGLLFWEFGIYVISPPRRSLAFC